MSGEARAPCATARCFAWGRLVRRGRGGIFSPVIHSHLQPDEFVSPSVNPSRALRWLRGARGELGVQDRSSEPDRAFAPVFYGITQNWGPPGPPRGFPKRFGGSKQVADVLVPTVDEPEHGRPRPHGGLEGPGVFRIYGHFGFFVTLFCAFAHLPCTHIPTALPQTSTRVTLLPPGGVPEALGPRQPLSSVTATPASRRDPAPPRRRLRPEEALGCGLRGLPQRPHFSRSEAPALFASGRAGLGAAWAKGHRVPGGDWGGPGGRCPPPTAL